MTRISAALSMAAALCMFLCGRPLPGLADACDGTAGEATCTDAARPAPPHRWPIPAAAPRPPNVIWSGNIPGFAAARELARFAAPGWQGQQKARIYLFGLPTLPATPVSCTVQLQKLDGTVLCEVQTDSELPENSEICQIAVRIATSIPILIMLTDADGGTCHMGGGVWEATHQ